VKVHSFQKNILLPDNLSVTSITKTKTVTGLSIHFDKQHLTVNYNLLILQDAFDIFIK